MLSTCSPAGSGGFSEGARQAGCNVVWAGNHWREACDVYQLNHGIKPACDDMHLTKWETVPKHDLLLASWACQGFTPAQGGRKPQTDTQRATAWAVVSAIEYHRPYAFIGENVPAFAKWELYQVWCEAMTRLGYALNIMVLDSADFGVPQNRVRLIIVGTRSKHPVELKLEKDAHVPASSFIEFNTGRWSPIQRKGRAENTVNRIANGRRQHGDRFLTAFYGAEKGGRSLHRPIGTIVTRDRWAVIDGDRMRMINVNEARKAMGYPDSYILPNNSRDAMHMLGNAVTPPKAKRVIEAPREAA